MAFTASFYGDEVYSLRIAQQPWAEIISNSMNDNHPPLHNLLLGLWLRLAGTSELNARGLSILCGLGLAAVLAMFGRDLAGQPAGYISFVLALCSPFLALYGWTLRWYTPTAALEIAALVLLYKAWYRDTWSLWLAYTLALVAMLYCEYSTALFIPCHWLQILWLTRNRDKGSWGRALFAQGIAGLLFAPYFLSAGILANTGGFDRSPVTGNLVGKAAYTAFAFVAGQTTLPNNYMVDAAVGIMLVFLALSLLREPSRSPLIPPLVLLFVPPALALLLKPGLFQPHYYLASAGGGMVFIGVVLAGTRRGWLRVGIVVPLAAAWGIGLMNWQLRHDYQRPELSDQWREVAAAVRARIKPDTRVVYTHPSFIYYLGCAGTNLSHVDTPQLQAWTEQRPTHILIEFSPLSGYDAALSRQFRKLCAELDRLGWQRTWEQAFNRDPAWRVKRRLLHREVPEWRTNIVLYTLSSLRPSE